jgi:hypothetical protein
MWDYIFVVSEKLGKESVTDKNQIFNPTFGHFGRYRALSVLAENTFSLCQDSFHVSKPHAEKQGS